MKCKNCEQQVSDKFCSHCGQRSDVGKITFLKLLSDLTESVFQFNTGLLFTIKELFTRPGTSILEYLNGKRKYHFKPIAYLLLFSTIYFFMAKFTKQATWMNDLITGFSIGAYGNSEDFELPNLISIVVDNFAYTTLLLIPLFSLASFLCFPNKANYLEHIVLNSYITGHQAILYIFFTILKSITDTKILDFLPVLVAVAYTFWVYSQFFKIGNRISKFIRLSLIHI